MSYLLRRVKAEPLRNSGIFCSENLKLADCPPGLQVLWEGDAGEDWAQGLSIFSVN